MQERHSIDGISVPVIKIYDEADGELVYAIRLSKNSARPPIFADGSYVVKLGDPDRNE